MASLCGGFGVVDPSACGHHSKPKPLLIAGQFGPRRTFLAKSAGAFYVLHPPWKPRRLGDQGYDLALVPTSLIAGYLPCVQMPACGLITARILYAGDGITGARCA